MVFFIQTIKFLMIGQKCCPFGQNGKPLQQATVQSFLEQDNIEWKPNQDFTKLSRSFFFRNIYSLTDFITQIYKLDAQFTQQIPNLQVKDRDLVKIQLHTPQLKGLSHRDLQLARFIDALDFDKYELIPIKNQQSYKKQIRKIQIQEKNEELMKQIQSTAGGSIKRSRENMKFRQIRQ